MTEIADILRRIVDQRRIRLQESLESEAGASKQAPGSGATPLGFTESLLAANGRAIIGEVKMGSPRLGSLAGTLDPEKQARLYADNGAAAISVVVEPDFFHGSYDLLSRCQAASGLPALAKDFIVHPRQLEWARQAGASAVLLIAALYSTDDLMGLAGEAQQLGLVPLVECHTRGDVERLRGGSWGLVGVNNRDLRTFEVDLENSMSLVPELPEKALRVAESGIRSGSDVDRLAAAGFDAFLIGETLLLAKDPAAKLRELVGFGADR